MSNRRSAVLEIVFPWVNELRPDSPKTLAAVAEYLSLMGRCLGGSGRKFKEAVCQ